MGEDERREYVYGMTDLPFAALAFERQEVQLVAKRHLAVGPNRFDVCCRHGAVACGFVGWHRIVDCERTLYSVNNRQRVLRGESLPARLRFLRKQRGKLPA